jgi:16S rRNA (guanine966-N2)-methyltransferase
MRVISGKYKGKNIMGFNVMGTRPTMDRVKESMFGMIQNNIKNSVCLDLFAGSGSLGIEALSNGAKECYFVEKNDEIYNILKDNLNGISNSFLIKKDYKAALNSFVGNIKFDLIFLDPPYKLNLISNILKFICDSNLLNDHGLVICEYENEDLVFEGLELIKSRRYGSKKVNIYKKF